HMSHAAVAQRAGERFVFRRAAELRIEGAVIDDVVAVRAARARLEMRRRVAVGDAEPVEVRHYSGSSGEPEAGVQLHAIRRHRDASTLGPWPLVWRHALHGVGCCLGAHQSRTGAHRIALPRSTSMLSHAERTTGTYRSLLGPRAARPPPSSPARRQRVGRPRSQHDPWLVAYECRLAYGGEPMSKGRLEAFSDGVIAILITIMVLELHVPHGEDSEALRPLVPVFLTYVLSFIYLGIYWNNHHHMFQATQRIDGRVLWANLHLLFWLSLIPFATGWMGENHFAPVPTAVYGVVLLMPALAWYGLQLAIIRRQGSASMLARAIGRDLKGKVSPVFYVAGILCAFLDTRLANAIMCWLPSCGSFPTGASKELS